jgi:hypothetical protein
MENGNLYVESGCHAALMMLNLELSSSLLTRLMKLPMSLGSAEGCCILWVEDFWASGGLINGGWVNNSWDDGS